MKLLRLHIEGFGKLQDFEYRFEEGLNTLHYPNGWGKSTLAVFIKAMLYGLPATSRRSLDENERKKYAPWQGGAYGGSLEFTCARGSFRIERFFGAKENADTFTLYDLVTNKPSTAFSAALGEELFGIDADGFERSTYLSQRALDTGKENNSISAKLGNLLDDVGDIGSFDTAMETLDKRRKYYVLTGNRGAIAEMEQARVEKQAELERCQRVQEAVKAQETELADCAAQIQALQKTADENRTRLQKAGLAREHAALLERKNKMLEELSVLGAQKKQIDEFFRNLPPSRGELAENQRLYESIKEASVRLDTIPKESPDRKELERLRGIYPTDTAAQTLARMDRANEALAEINARCDTLAGARDADETAHRFDAGIPSNQQLDAAFAELEQAKKLQNAIDGFANTPDPAAKKSPLLPLAVLLCVLGAVLALLSFLPALAALAGVILVLGAIVLVGGIVLCVVALRINKENLRRSQALHAKKQAWEDRREKSLHTVRELLAAYGMPTEPDLSRALTELALLTAQYREGQQKRRRIREELDSLAQRREETVASLRLAFRRFGQELPPKKDYRDDIERLRRELERLTVLESAEQRRIHERESTETTLQELKTQLLPFLRRYDPTGTMRAGDCLTRIAEQLAERNRLLHLMVAKERELKDFIAEKNLDEISSNINADDFERLTSEERKLLSRIEDLQRRHTLLKSGIERLTADTDRIPELEASLAQMKERISEARANAATIANTAKFLEEAKTALSTRYLDGMQESFGQYLTALIGEGSPDALMDTSFAVRLREGGQTRTMESFSRGWRDAVQFCVRLSLTDALYRDSEPPFLLLDDPFVNLDDERLDAARALLDSIATRYQIIYLVCHKERV